jgi:hypothetical protein
MLDWDVRGELIKKERERLESEIAEILNRHPKKTNRTISHRKSFRNHTNQGYLRNKRVIPVCYKFVNFLY